MAVRRVQLRRGTTADHTNGDGFTGAVGEITVDTTTKSIRVHDGAQAGGFDLMRADMSNNLAVTGNINFTDDAHVIGGDINTNANDGGDATHILDLGGANTTIRVRGTLNVANQTTQNDLLIENKVIVLADGDEGEANSTDSIGILFTRTLAGGGGAQDPALFYWDESADRFRIETNNVTEANANWTGGATGADLTLRTLYAQTSVDVNDGNITNVGQISLDSITFADAGAFITITAEDALDGKAFNLNDGGGTEYLTINTNAESTTLGVPAKTTTIRSNTVDLGTDAANNVALGVVARTGVNAGQSLTISAGSAPTGGDEDLNGGDLILATGAGDGTGTASIQFQTKVSGTDTVAERMRIHTNGNVGIGENAPDTLLHISGADTATLTLENTTGGNAQDDDPTTISFKGNAQAKALAQIVGAHDGVADDDKGVLIFKPNNDADPTEALRLDSALKATFAGAVEIATSLDLTDGAINNVTTIDLDKITDRANDGIEIELQDGQASALVIDDTNGDTFLTIDADANTITLGQATTLDSTLVVNGGSATVQGGDGNPANLFLNADRSDDAGDNWRVQATDHATRTLTFAGENNAGNGYVDVLTLTGANAEGSTSATVKGTLIVNGEIQSATDLVFQVDNDNNGNNKFAFQAGDNTEVASLTEAGVLTVTGLSNLNGGIAVDTDKFTVDGGGTGNTATKGTLTVSGNTVVGVAGEGSPNLSVINNAGNTTFSVTGLTGNTEVAGTTTLSNTLNIVMDVASGIVFNSDRDAEGDKDAALILVKDSAGGTDGAFAWDDGLNTFSFSGSKLNSVLDFSVGTLATPSTTISATTGAIATAGTAPVLTLKNTTGGNDDADSPTLINFQDDDGADLARIQGSHDGGNDDTKGDLIFSTNGGAGLSEALRLDSANLATFAGNITAQDITASNGTINVGGNGASIVATNATTLTITEDTIVAAGNLQVNGNITGDANEAKEIFVASVAEASTITLGGGGTVVSAGKLRLGSNIIENSASETTITLDVNQRTTLSGDLVVQGGAGGGLGSTTILLGADAARDSVIKVVARTGANDGQDLTIEAGSSATDQADQNGGDLILSSGGGDGTGTSDMVFKTKITNVDAPTTKMTLKGSGRLGLGETAPDTLLHLSNASSPTITLQNLTASQAEDGRSSVIKFVGQNNANTEGELGNITTAHDVGNATAAGKMVFSLFNSVDNAVGSVLTLDSAKKATFAKDVEITGDLIVQGDTTTINTATLDVEDAVIRINKGVAGGANTNDIGIFFERGTDGNDGIFFWGDDESYFILGTTTAAHTAVDFAGSTTPSGLQIASLELRDDNATSLVIKEAGNAYLTFNTLDADGGNGNEQVEFGKIFTAITGSKIGNLTLANGSITDSGGAISLGDNTLTTSGLASLDGGIDVNGEVFTVSDAGATVIKNTLTLNNANSTSDIDVQANGTSVFKVDVSANQAIINDGTLKVDKIQASTDGDDSFQLYLKDNTALGLVVSNVSDNVDFITVKTTTNSELITLVQATSISETLEVVGNATFDAEINIEQANTNGIFFNSDLGANPSIDATLITVEGGNNKGDVVLAWDTSDNALNLNGNSQVHLQGLNGSNALTIGGALVANATITMTTAGAITATSATSAFASGTTIGNVTYSNNEIAGATDTTLTIKAETDLIFQIDSDNDGGDVQKFSFLDGAGTEIANLSEVGALQIDGDLSVDGGDITLTGGQDTNAEIELKSDAGDDAGDSWNILATANSDQLTIGNDKAQKGTYAPILTLVGNATATNTTATFAGDVLLNGGDLTVRNKVDEGHAVITLIADSLADADGDDNGDVWKLDAADDTATLTVFNNISGGDVAQLTLLGNGTATSGLATFAGDVKLNGSDLTITSPDATAVINIQSHLGDANGDSWKITGSKEDVRTLTFSGQNSNNANYQNVLVLTANDTLTDSLATFGGDVTILGGAINLTNGATIDSNTEGKLILTEDLVETTGDLAVNGGDVTITAGGATAANLYLMADSGTDAGDEWRVQANTNDTFSIGNDKNVAGAYVSILTLTGNASATSTNATFAGEVTISGTGTNALDFSANNITIGNAIAGNTLTLGASASTVAIPGDLTVATTKSITLNNGVANAAADVDAYIYVDRGADDDVAIRWDEGTDRWMHTLDGTNYYNIVNENDVLFIINGDKADTDTISIKETDERTVQFKGLTVGTNRGFQFDVDNANNTVELSFEDIVIMPDSLTVKGISTVEGQLFVESNDIDLDSENATFGASLGANTLTIGGATSTVAVAGSLVVNGTSIDVDGASALTVGATVGANDLTLGGATSTVVSAGDLKVEGNLVYDSSELTVDEANPAKITVTKPYHTVDTFGDAGNDDLEDIQGGITGMVVVLQLNTNGRVVTLKHSTNGGNLRLSGGADFELNNKDATISLIYNGSTWCELTRSTNNA